MIPWLLFAGHMCDESMWSGVGFQGPVVHADITRDDRVEGMAQRALEAAPPRFVAVGFSMGGIAAIQLARLAGARMAGLVLLDTNPGADLPERQEMRLTQQDAVRAGRLREVVADELKPNYLAEANCARRDLLHQTMAMALDLGPDVFLRQVEALRVRPDSWPLLGEIVAPVLAACGIEDRLCTPAMHRKIADHAPRGECAVIEGAGHLLPLEQPVALSQLLKKWAQRHHLELEDA